MKKFTVLALAALLVVAFTVPAFAAVENIFGGYWRTRMYQQRNFAGDDGALNQTRDAVMVDTRTRLFYTAKINDKLKFVNAFELDAVWGSPTSYGFTGTDFRDVQVKHSYVDALVGPVNLQIGAQLYSLARGLISGDDAIGMKAIWKVNDGLYLPFVWNKFYEGNTVVGEDLTRGDIDMYVFAPVIMLSKDIKISPYYVFVHSQNGQAFTTLAPSGAANGSTVILPNSFDNLNAHMFGFDFDGKFGPASLWFTGVWQQGSAIATGAATTAGITPGTEIDMEGYAVFLGGKFDLGKAEVRGQFLYATGEENGLTDGELNVFLGAGSQIFTWAEILSGGVVDNQIPVGAPTGVANKVGNVIAYNLGVTVKPMDKLSIAADLWYAELDEPTVFANGKKSDKLGLEVDLKATYKLVEGLNLDVIAAYLFAGDAISTDGKNDSNPYELITQLSLSF